MDTEKEKRNSKRGIDQAGGERLSVMEGVGGRQSEETTPAGGGGYQNKYPVLNFPQKNGEKKRDPRLDELRRMGLQRVWMEVAETIGVDAFLAMWRILDADPSTHSKEGRLEVSLRLYRSYLRFQRNRYIEALSKHGNTLSQIRKKLSDSLCERIGIAHISRIARKG